MIFPSNSSFFGAVAILAILAAPAFGQTPAPTPTPETLARHAMIVDGASGAILYEKAVSSAFPPASLAKLMTMEIVFGAIQTGEVRSTTTFRVSETAWRTGGAPSGTATMFADVRSEIPVEALIQGVVVQGANDAAIILAEGLAGSEAAFADRMNERAAELGLTGSRFVNATGLPAEGQSVTARDLSRLARHIKTTYPEQYGLYAQGDFEWNGIRQRNRNPLLGLEIGATGMGTGFTDGVGYALVGAASVDGRETFLTIAGVPSERERTSEAVRLLKWSRESFRPVTLFSAGETVTNAAVFGGVSGTVPLVVTDELVALAPTDDVSRVHANVFYEGPLRAPVAAGTEIGRIDIFIGDQMSLSRPLFAGGDVPVGTFASRAAGAVQELAFGWVRAF